MNLMELSRIDDFILGQVIVLPDTDSHFRESINKGERSPSNITMCNGHKAEEDGEEDEAGG